MRRSIIHYTAFVLAGPGAIGLLATMIFAVILIAHLANEQKLLSPYEE